MCTNQNRAVTEKLKKNKHTAEHNIQQNVNQSQFHPMIRYILTAVIIAILLAGSYGLYKYYQPAENIAEKDFELVVQSSDLISAFEADAVAADASHTKKVIAVEGKVKMMESPTSVVFSTGGGYIISFQFNEPLTKTYQEGELLTIKGQYNGYLAPDAIFDMPGNIQISQCVIIQ